MNVASLFWVQKAKEQRASRLHVGEYSEIKSENALYAILIYGDAVHFVNRVNVQFRN